LTLWALFAIIYTYSKESEMKIVIKVKPKHREHFVLFAQNTPFKQKVVESKVLYRRNKKYKGRDYE